ncbi:MAG: aldehyde dehydrogenase family protein [Microbacterium sp.]|uniref:aldehyde dehydrogenase family protein n=1 Tax=Microbacterium sp. TaxID=51671 RepID=UPI001AC81210|nr:aldehyde dehydrogenase family protein [Microbacterium sp.]MBN9177461.1 aldehyde dehydrogenase family protein [Microbacterium sp.]
MTVIDNPGTVAARRGHLIPGHITAADAPVFERRSPFDGSLVAEVVLGTPADTRAAIAAARNAFDHGPWPKLPGTERAKILLRWAGLVRENAEELARLETAEVGKPIGFARAGDVPATLDTIEAAALAAAHVKGELHDDLGGAIMGLVRREPVGVVGAIVPWNFPALLYSHKVAFALAAGCTVVVKPSEFTSGSAILLTRLAHRAGVPEDALVLVTGTGPDAGQPLAESTDVDLLSFTGSTRTARLLAAVDRPYPQVQHFELGGKGATIVFADADLDQAVDGALFGFAINNGETCTAGTRLLVEDAIADEFVARLAQKAAQLTVGDPWSESTVVGPLIHAQHTARVRGFIDEAAAAGSVVISPELPASTSPESFVAPTIIDRVETDSRLFQEEVFGPVLAVKRFSGVDEAVRLANSTVYGLANSIWTSDTSTALTVARALKSGTVWINTIHDTPGTLPFGGVAGSGIGREKGVEGLVGFTQLKTITVQVAPRSPIYG